MFWFLKKFTFFERNYRLCYLELYVTHFSVCVCVYIWYEPNEIKRYFSHTFDAPMALHKDGKAIATNTVSYRLHQ